MNANELDDDKIGQMIDSKTTEAISWFSSKLSRERENVLDYVNRKLPKPFFQNGTRWVSPICYNELEFMRAQLGDTFSAGSGLITFKPMHGDDIEPARIATEYVNHVFFVENDGEKIIRDAIFDGLTARNAVAKVFWDKDYDYEVREFDKATQADLDLWQQDDDITDLQVAPNGDGTFLGKLVQRTDKGQVRIEVIRPDEFAIEKNATGLTEDYFMVHRTERTLDWVLSQWPEFKGREDEILGAGAGRTSDLNLSPENLARHDETDYGYLRPGSDTQDELQMVVLVEAYSQFKRKGDLTARLYKVIRAGTVNIEIEPCEDLPFVMFTPIPRPHVFYGENYIKTLMPTQDMHTAAYRLISDSAMLANTPRWVVEKGALVDPRSLLDARLGGVIQVKNMAGVQPLPQPQMNPMLFNLVQGLEAQIEATSGISLASVGLNKDVISSQNSAAMMEQNTNNSMTKQKEISRNFGKQFLCALFEKIWSLCVQFEKREKMIEIAGNFIPVSLSSCEQRRHAVASMHLGYGERAAQAQKILEFGAMLKQNGGDVFCGYEGFYNMLSDAMTLEGHRIDIPRYLPVTPDKVPPPTPSPREEAEVKQINADAESKIITAQTGAKKVADHTELSMLKTRLAALEAHFAQVNKDSDTRRKDADVANRIDIGQREMKLEEEQAAKATESQVRTIVSP